MTCSRGCCETQLEHYRSISVSASATPTRRQATAAIDKKEAGWSRDHDAYRRLRRNGLQPRHIDGSAHLEANAATEIEVTSGKLLSPEQAKTAESAIAEMNALQKGDT